MMLPKPDVPGSIAKQPTLLPELNRPFIKQFLPKNPVIVEAGAHIGRDTLKLHALWPQGTIHAFEPVPALYQKLATCTKNLSAIKTYELALSNKSGCATMHVSPELGAVSSLLKPTGLREEKPDISFKSITVPTATLDEWAHNTSVGTIDFLWLDLQGHELVVLQASPQCLRSVKAIYTEASTCKRYKGQSLYKELKNFLKHQGFFLAAQHFHHTTWGNVLFVRN